MQWTTASMPLFYSLAVNAYHVPDDYNSGVNLLPRHNYENILPVRSAAALPPQDDDDEYLSLLAKRYPQLDEDWAVEFLAALDKRTKPGSEGGTELQYPINPIHCEHKWSIRHMVAKPKDGGKFLNKFRKKEDLVTCEHCYSDKKPGENWPAVGVTPKRTDSLERETMETACKHEWDYEGTPISDENGRQIGTSWLRTCKTCELAESKIDDPSSFKNKEGEAGGRGNGKGKGGEPEERRGIRRLLPFLP